MRMVVDEGAEASRFVTAGRFDLDNVGTHIGEHSDRIIARENC